MYQDLSKYCLCFPQVFSFGTAPCPADLSILSDSVKMNKNFSFTKPHKSDYKTYRVYVKSFGKEKPQGFRPGIQAEILAEIWLRTQMFDIEVMAQNYLQDLNTRYFFVTDGSIFLGYYYDTTQYIRLENIPQYKSWYYYPTKSPCLCAHSGSL